MKKFILIIAAVFLFTSCKKEQGIELSDSKITIHYDEKKQLTVSFLDEEMEYSFKSNNENIAKVSESGEVSGVSIGMATITATSKDGEYKAECKVIIKPYYSFLYKDLCLEFGCNKQNVKDFETREIYKEDDNSLVYNGDMDYIIMVRYGFEEFKLASSAIFIDSYMNEILSEYLFERYKYLGCEDNIFVFMTYDEKTYVGLTLMEDLTWALIFVENISQNLYFFGICIKK
jgi:hypothetical protein